ncbi:MAG: hypothetical protein QM783_13835 [Phycisphaerales bacterium]
MNKLSSAVVLCCALAPMSTAFGQGMMGATLNYAYYFPDSSTVYEGAANYTVTSSVEVAGVLGTGTVDLTDSQCIIHFQYDGGFFTPSDFNGIIWSDLTNNLPAITGVTVDPATNWVGFDASRVSWTADSFSVNLQGLNTNSQWTIVLNVATPTPGAAAVLGLGGLASVRRRRR